MPLNDIDLVRRRYSVKFPIDHVDIIVYSYNEEIFEEKHFQSASELINLFKNEPTNKKCYWIEVINRSSVNLPTNIQLLCEFFDIHPLTIEDITTLAAYVKLDLFYDQLAIYLLMKIISWNGQRVEQQQISFYLKCSKNILITFQEQLTDDSSIFDPIRNRLQSPANAHDRLKQMNVDYLFYCLFDAIIDRCCFSNMKRNFH
jgi:Mg2+ and Co2+ transporter CorA